MKSSRWPNGLIKIKFLLNFDKRDTEICNSRVLYTNLTIGCGNKVMEVVTVKFLGVENCDNLAWRKRVNMPSDLLRHVLPRCSVIPHNRRVQLTCIFPFHYVSQSHRLRETQQTRRYSPYKKWYNLMVVPAKHLLHVKLRSSFISSKAGYCWKGGTWCTLQI